MVARILRTSERADFLRCQQRWWWSWREGLVPRGYVPDALWFGTGIHVALATWYCGPGTKRGEEPAETWYRWASDDLRTLKTQRVVDDEIEKSHTDARDLGVAMLEGYRRLYDRDEHKLIISPEKTFRLDVPWPSDQKLYEENVPHAFEPSVSESPDLDRHDPDWRGLICRICGHSAPHVIHDPLVTYCGTYDSVWRHADTGQLWLDEHKTAAAISTGHLTLDPQAGSYWALATRALQAEGAIRPSERLRGIEYNFLRKALPDDRPRDEEGYACNRPTKADYLAAFADQWIDASGATILSAYYGGDEKALSKLKLDDLEHIAVENEMVILGARSKQQPAPLFYREQVHRTGPERRMQLLRLQAEALSQQAVIDGVLPILKTPTRECNMGGFRCPHFEMCTLHEAGGDWEYHKGVAYTIRDPYADHRQPEEGKE